MLAAIAMPFTGLMNVSSRLERSVLLTSTVVASMAVSPSPLSLNLLSLYVHTCLQIPMQPGYSDRIYGNIIERSPSLQSVFSRIIPSTVALAVVLLCSAYQVNCITLRLLSPLQMVVPLATLSST
jgi:hypothetical protein